jgi:acetyl coenzyme A synthetase (ADP forming)-like protein
VGAEIFHNLLREFRGDVFPVNPSAETVAGVRAYASVTEIPRSVDLAVVAVPQAAVAGVLDSCIAKDIKAVVVITAGFGETGAPGRAAEARLRDTARRAGMRVIGPNCMGVVNTDPVVRLNASFSPISPPAGSIALASQSGALALAIIERARQLNLGLSSVVSTGNAADVSPTDLLEHWEHDAATRVILLYLESVDDVPDFRRIAARLTRKKPIVAIKAGRSRSGSRAAASHTGALATDDRLVDALFHETGVIRARTLEELHDVARLLANQPLPAGARVAVVTNAGGPGILAADACEALGLTLPSLETATSRALAGFLSSAASLANPIDMLATASAADFGRAVRLALADPNVDSVLTIFIPPLVTDAREVARAVAEAAAGASKPVLASFFGATGVPDLLAAIPCYTYPEAAARALAHAVHYAAHRLRPHGVRARFDDLDIGTAQALVTRTADTGGGWMSPPDCAALLRACGIAAIPTEAVRSPDEACAAARRLGFPVAVKGSGPNILHKTEANAVHLGLADDAAVIHAFRQLSNRSDVKQIVLQPMTTRGIEMFVGATFDRRFGHAVVCGTGGTLVELLDDTACRLAPLTDRAAQEMVDALTGSALLRGFRGTPVAHERALVEVLLRVSALLEACPGVLEMDLNPVMVTPTGAAVVDARVRVGSTQHDPSRT